MGGLPSERVETGDPLQQREVIHRALLLCGLYKELIAEVHSKCVLASHLEGLDPCEAAWSDNHRQPSTVSVK